MDPEPPDAVTRREFLQIGLAGFATAVAGPVLGVLRPLVDVDNPLEYYPGRDWEKLYRDQYRYDSTFTFVCAPNDTHNCRLRAFVRNGVIVRIEQAYDVTNYTDLQGNKTTATWHPRGCLKGYTYMRRVYNRFRVKEPLVRQGWKKWVEEGFPRNPETGRPPQGYFRRGEDEWVQVSWDEINDLVAKCLMNIARSYSGPQGEAWLKAQEYPQEMIEPMRDPDGEVAGVRTMKFRGGMAFLGATRLTGLYRLGNLMALLDHYVRGVPSEKCLGVRGWDNYAWHTDLPPGHAMVHGVQTFDQEFHDFWNAEMIVIAGLNLVENKMADPIWWHAAIERQKKIVVIAPEHSPTVPKGDYWLAVRPGTDAALMLGVAGILIREKLYKEDFAKKFSNFPFLVRMDNLKLLTAEDLNDVVPLDPGETYTYEDGRPIQEDAEKYAVSATVSVGQGDKILAVTRNCLGKYLEKELHKQGLTLDEVDLDFEGEVSTRQGKVKVKSVFRLYRELTEHYSPEATSQMTGIPTDKILRFAHDIAASKTVSFLCGMGMNMYFHNDLINRSFFVVACLTGNVGIPGGNVSSYAGNYKAPIFNGLPSYVAEDPFNQTLDPNVDGKKVRKKNYLHFESIHFWAHGDYPLIVDTPKEGRVVLTEKGHMPSPSKVVWTCNANQIGNAKWAYDIIKNVLPGHELHIAMDYEWCMNCEYADVVFPVDSWVEFAHPDMTASATNPFLQFFPKGGIKRLHNTRHDIEVYSGVAKALSRLTGDKRFRQHYKFVEEDRVDVYMQRILDASNAFRGYKVKEIMKNGGAALVMFRTYPRIPGWEQIRESVPFYTKTGRLELYRDEQEWIDQGENLVVHREPVEATPHQPNVIVVSEHFDCIRPKDYGVPPDELDGDLRGLFNQKWPWQKVRQSVNPLTEKYGLFAVFVTCKSRHRVHSSWSTVDWNRIWASNFGDPYRVDKRSPWVGEEELDINPEDAQALGIEDGDYVYVDASPLDRPFRGKKGEDPFFDKMSRFMIRARYNPSFPRGFMNMKHSIFGATHRSVRAQQKNPDGGGVTDTGYVPCSRFGSHQSCVRTWLNPTQMTGSLVHKDYFTHKLVKGFTVDTHTPTGAPKESLVKVTFAEKGGIGGKGVWQPVKSGMTPAHENQTMKRYLKGGFISEV
jgi:nitrate reductase alpha subunit